MKKLLLVFGLLTLTSCQQSTLPLTFQPAPALLQAQSARVVFHVVPSPDGAWEVKQQGNAVPLSRHRTKAEAVDQGRLVAKSQGLAQLIVHKQNGQIETEYTYGNDPKDILG